MRDLEPESAVREAEDLVAARSLPPGVCDDDDLELEPFRRVDREQPHRVGPFLLRHGVALRGARGVLLGDEADEPLEIGPSQLLERPGEPGELPQVRVPPLPVAPREHRKVVVVLDEDPFAEQLERQPRRALDEALVPLEERAHEASIVLREVGGQRALDALEDRATLRGRANEDEGIVRHAHERRRQDGEERLVVVPVLEEPQIGEQIDDLLLAEVATSGHPDRREADERGAPPRTTRRRFPPRREGRSHRASRRPRRRAHARARRHDGPRPVASGAPTPRMTPCR